MKKPSGRVGGTVEMVCKQCGKDFKVYPHRKLRAKYCSVACYVKGNTSEKTYSKPRVCVSCGDKFLPTAWSQKYCKRECFTTSIRRKKKIPCPTCNKTFLQVRVEQKYCSRKCGEPLKKKNVPFKKSYADLLWSNLVKLLCGIKCEYCGKEKSLNSHHIFSRSNLGLRWDTNNGISLCAEHHVLGLFSAHKAPLEFAEWLKETRGEEWYHALVVKSRVITKMTTADKLAVIASLKERIEKLRKLDEN